MNKIIKTLSRINLFLLTLIFLIPCLIVVVTIVWILSNFIILPSIVTLLFGFISGLIAHVLALKISEC